MFRAMMFCAAAAMPVAAMAAMPMTASTYVMKAGAGDKYEIESSRLELHSANPKIRQFAERMIADHTKTTDEVKAAAMKAGMKVAPPMLNPAQATMIAKLRKVSGAARDRLYIEQQKTAHQQALMLHQDYAANGTVPSLRMAAAKVVPVVQSHIQMLASM